MAWEKFERIVKDIEKDIKIDRMNMDEKSLQIPSIKHYWIAELYRSKIQIQNLEKKKRDLFKAFAESDKIMEIGLSKDAIQRQFNATAKVQEINEAIEELKIIVEYLEDAKYVLGRVTDDLKNRIELEKVERL
ncbi:MAG: recombination mediator protein UvsY [Paludibacteraceae bacterium]|nr:recombination mediator protein UvsY [Paludibacteraceae bacterium]